MALTVMTCMLRAAIVPLSWRDFKSMKWHGMWWYVHLFSYINLRHMLCKAGHMHARLKRGADAGLFPHMRKSNGNSGLVGEWLFRYHIGGWCFAAGGMQVRCPGAQFCW